MNPWWLRVGKHRDLRKGILESSRLKDTIRVTDSVCYSTNHKPKDSADQHIGEKEFGSKALYNSEGISIFS
jgi:hypothetical protein